MILVERNLLVVTELATSGTQCSSSCFLREIWGGGWGRGGRYDSSFLVFTARKRSLRRLCFYTCLSFCSRGGGTWAGTPPGRYPPLAGTLPGQVHPLAGTPPPGQVHPPGRYTPSPPPAVHAGIRSASGRYASYWNAFLFVNSFLLSQVNHRE